MSDKYVDPFRRNLEEINRTYCDLKNLVMINEERIRELETENAELKRTIASLKCDSDKQSAHKRRKTQSVDTSYRSSVEIAFDQSLSSSKELNDESHASFCQAEDEFNVAIHDMSCRTQYEDEDEEICATPAAPTSAIKRERFKSSIHEQSTKSIKVVPTPKPLAKQIVRHEENIPTVKIKCEPNSQGSPLKEINQFDAIHQSSSKGNISDCPAVSKEEKSKIKTFLFNDWSSNEDIKPKAFDLTETRNKEPNRKSLSLSTKKLPRLKQSLLEFSGYKTGKGHKQHKTGSDDLDETYCDGLSSILSRKSSNHSKLNLTNSPQRPSSTDILIGFPAKSPINIKPEPVTQKALKNRVASSEFKNTSSVFALLTQTDEIVIVEDSQPMFTTSSSQDIKSEPDESETVVDNRKTVRTEYRQPVAVRTLKDKAAQPGFVCPDCGPWFKYVHAGLSDREIQRRLDNCSRHRSNVANELPSTPEGFWIPYFVATQEEHKQETLVHYRLKSKQEMVDESIHFY